MSGSYARRTRPWCLGAPTLVLALALCAPAPAQDADAAHALATARELSRAFAAVAQRVTPAVVNISSTRLEAGRRAPVSPLFWGLFPEFGDLLVEPPREVRSLGSGVIIRPEGYIITNHHVIQGARQITVKLWDDTEYEATVVGQDPLTDLAVIKVEGDDLPAAQFGDSDRLEVGEWVIAVGSPLGLAQTVTAGIVSAKGRKNIGIQGYEDFIQTDAAINPGNSGGALVNLEGLVVGINTAIASQSGGYDGICFATPSAVAAEVAEKLIRHGRIRRPWLGIVPRGLDTRAAARMGLPEGGGVVVGNIVRNSPAHRAGLAPGDIIRRWGEQPVATPAALVDAVLAAPIGETMTVLIFRGGRHYRAGIEVQERPDGMQLRGVL